MDKVRIGMIGFGNMGSSHAGYYKDLNGGVLAAVCDPNPAKQDLARNQFGVKHIFKTHKELLASGLCDAVVVATPHYDHIPIALDAMAAGLHVMIEKPMAVSVSDAKRMNEEYNAKYKHLKFGIMFNQRTNNMYRKVRELIAGGELGEVTRITWLITNWFRTWSYYASGGWRGTWKGEGGGVLINQCPHNLDLIQWVVNGLMPSRVTAVGFIGKTHPIEVEDEISAILEYPNGAIGHFVTSTGEAPGTNRLEICGDRGKIIAENGRITFFRTRESVKQVNQTSRESFASVETWEINVPYPANPNIMEHQIVTQRFVDVIRENRPNGDLIAEGTEGINGLMLGNAMMMAGLTRAPVELPVDGARYDAFINDMARKYGGKKTLETREASVNFAASAAR
jgi:predicted dehydrogenase